MSAECDSHPASYLNSGAKQRELEKTIRAQILANMADKTWKSYSSNHAGNTINLTKGNSGISIYFTQDSNKFYVHKDFDVDNVFIFEASIRGHYDVVSGEKRLQLELSLDKEASLIDGFRLSYLFGERVGLKNTTLSTCMAEYIKSIELSSDIIGGRGPTPPGRQPGGSAGAGGLCDHSVRTSACTPWSCREQIFITVRPCN